MTKIKNTTQLKRIVSAFLLISALGLNAAAQAGNIGDDRSGQTVGSGGRSSQIVGSGSRSSQIIGSGSYTDGGGMIGSGTATASPDSGRTLEFVWSWFEDIF